MRLIYVIRELPPFPGTGGTGSHVWDTSRALVKAGHEVTVVCASGDTRRAEETVTDGVHVIRLSGGDFAFEGVEWAGGNPFGRRWRQLTRFWSYRRKVADCVDSLIDQGKGEIVEFSRYGSEGAIWLTRTRRVPAVLRYGGFIGRDKTFPVSRPWKWIAYRRSSRCHAISQSADGYMACSHALAERLSRSDPSLARRVEVIWNFVDASWWEQQSRNGEQTGEKDRKEVFFAGSVAPHKGVMELVRAVEMLRMSGMDIRLTLAGTQGEVGRRLQLDHTSRGPGESWLTLLGKVPRARLAELYTRASVVCFPSWWEAFGIVCLEAMAAGAIVVGSTAGGMSEIIRDGVDGFLVEPKDPKLLAGCLKKALGLSGEKRDAMLRSAGERVRVDFGADTIVPRMLYFYARVIDQFGGRGRIAT
jgi:glycogen synthase